MTRDRAVQERERKGLGRDLWGEAAGRYLARALRADNVLIS